MYSEKGKRSIHVCFSPLSWPLFVSSGALVVVTDIFRATSAICAGIAHGIEAIVPVEHINESRDWKSKGFITAGERDGKKLDFADFGNSPFNFMQDELRGQTVVMNTTNGTRAIKKAASEGSMVVVGAFGNLRSVCDYAENSGRDVIILCAGWKDRFCLEDSLFAGAVAQNLLKRQHAAFYTTCDSTMASVHLWRLAKQDLPGFIDDVAHRHRLQKMGLDDVIPFCLEMDRTDVVPVYREGRLVSHMNLL